MNRKVCLLLVGVALFLNCFAFANVITSFEDLRDGAKVSLTGKIVQVIEGNGFLFDVSNEKSFKASFVFVTNATNSFFEGQKLTIEGKMTGTYSYTLKSGDRRTVPYITPEQIK